MNLSGTLLPTEIRASAWAELTGNTQTSADGDGEAREEVSARKGRRRAVCKAIFRYRLKLTQAEMGDRRECGADLSLRCFRPGREVLSNSQILIKCSSDLTERVQISTASGKREWARAGEAKVMERR